MSIITLGIFSPSEECGSDRILIKEAKWSNVMVIFSFLLFGDCLSASFEGFTGEYNGILENGDEVLVGRLAVAKDKVNIIKKLNA